MSDAEPGLRERKNARTRAAIVRAALELMLEFGFDDVTVAQIAARADVSVRTVYTWFATKQDVVFADADVHMEHLAEELAGGEGDTLDRICAWQEAQRALNSAPDDLVRLRVRLVLSDPRLEVFERGRLAATQDLIAASFADELGVAAGSAAPRALAAAVVETLLVGRRAYAQGEPITKPLGGTLAMLRAAVSAAGNRES